MAVLNSQVSRYLRNFDYTLLVVSIILIIYGILMIASATEGAIDPTLATRVQSQTIFAVVGVVVVVIIAAIDYRLLTSTYLWIYGVIVLFLGVGGILGVEGEAGAQSWLNFGIAGFQPSELAKMLLIIVLAQQLHLNADKIGKLETILKSLVFVAIPVFFIFIQPDLGITILVLVIWFVMVWGAGMRWQHVASFVDARA